MLILIFGENLLSTVNDYSYLNCTKKYNNYYGTTKSNKIQNQYKLIDLDV